MIPGIALDIDNTLAATNIAWATEMQKQFGNPEGLTPEEIWEKYALVSNVPYWDSPEAQAWMEHARNSNDFQEGLPLIENANHIVNRIHATVPIKAYITGRWESVREKTEAWLWKHEFPNAPVYMRPMDTEGMRVNEWKASFLGTVYPEIAGIVDDDPRLLDHLAHEYPGTVFLYRNTKYARTPVEVITCASWEKIEEAMGKRYA